MSDINKTRPSQGINSQNFSVEIKGADINSKSLNAAKWSEEARFQLQPLYLMVLRLIILGKRTCTLDFLLCKVFAL